MLGLHYFYIQLIISDLIYVLMVYSSNTSYKSVQNLLWLNFSGAKPITKIQQTEHSTEKNKKLLLVSVSDHNKLEISYAYMIL